MARKSSPQARVDVKADLRYLYRRKSAVENLIRLLEKYQGVTHRSHPESSVRGGSAAKTTSV